MITFIEKYGNKIMGQLDPNNNTGVQ